jgi:hypothetical protein
MQLLNDLKAEVVLKDTTILGQIENLKTLLTYKTDAKSYEFEDYFHILNKEIQGIERIELSAAIPPGGAQSYLVELATALQLVTDKIEVSQMKAIYFQGKLKSALHLKDNLLATFSAWYLIAVAEKLKEAEIKIPASTQKALAESEFSRLIGDIDMGIDGLMSAVEVMVVHLKEMKKIAQEKYKLGTDQANASIVNLPFNGVSESKEQFPLLKQRWKFEEPPSAETAYDDVDLPDADEDPAYVQKKVLEHPEVPQGIHKIIETPVFTRVVADEVSAEQLEAAIADFKEQVADHVIDKAPSSLKQALVVDFDDIADGTLGIAGLEEEIKKVDAELAANFSVKNTVINDEFAGEIAVLAGKATLVPQSKKKISFDDDEDEETPVVVKEEKPEVRVIKPVEGKPKKKITFDDDEEDDQIPF